MILAAAHPSGARAAVSPSGGALAELMSQSGAAVLPEVVVPKAVLASYVDVPVYGDDYATGLVQPLYQLKQEQASLGAQLEQATLPNRLMSCARRRWPDTSFCAASIREILALTQRYIEAERGLKRHTERLFVKKEVERLKFEGRAVVQDFYDEERFSHARVFEALKTVLSSLSGSSGSRRFREELADAERSLVIEHRAIHQMIQDFGWDR